MELKLFLTRKYDFSACSLSLKQVALIVHLSGVGPGGEVTTSTHDKTGLWQEANCMSERSAF